VGREEALQAATVQRHAAGGGRRTAEAFEAYRQRALRRLAPFIPAAPAEEEEEKEPEPPAQPVWAPPPQPPQLVLAPRPSAVVPHSVLQEGLREAALQMLAVYAAKQQAIAYAVAQQQAAVYAAQQQAAFLTYNAAGYAAAVNQHVYDTWAPPPPLQQQCVPWGVLGGCASSDASQLASSGSSLRRRRCTTISDSDGHAVYSQKTIHIPQARPTSQTTNMTTLLEFTTSKFHPRCT
jgi:hypothetical protein